MDKKTLSTLNFQGFIVAPFETEEKFKHRIALLRLQTTYNKILDKENSLLKKIKIKVFDIESDWIYSFQKKSLLNFFEPAKTWIYSYENTSVPLIQIAPNQKKSQLKAMLQHETTHAVRSAFPHSKFEEFFAYMSALHPLRRLFGPLFQNSLESSLLLIFSFFPLIFFTALPVVSFLPFFSYFLFLLVRLFIRWNILNKCLFHLSKICSPYDPSAIALRLTDQEIYLFSKKTTPEIIHYISKQTSLRWKQILFSYSFKDLR